MTYRVKGLNESVEKLSTYTLVDETKTSPSLYQVFDGSGVPDISQPMLIDSWSGEVMNDGSGVEKNGASGAAKMSQKEVLWLSSN